MFFSMIQKVFHANSKIQSFLILIISLLISFSYNFILSDGITIIANDLKLIDSNDSLDELINDPQIRIIGLKTAKELHEKGNLFVDARSVEYLEDGFIPGAIAHDNEDILANMIEDKIGMDKLFVIYCSDDDCGSSEDLAYSLQGYGFSNILVFKGGWKVWKESGFSFEKYE